MDTGFIYNFLSLINFKIKLDLQLSLQNNGNEACEKQFYFLSVDGHHLSIEGMLGL